MIAFKKIQYADADGKTPADCLCELLNGGIDVMKLATFMSQIPNEGTLKGTALKKTKSPSIGIWVLSQGKYHLYYSYFKDRNEVCFLYLLHGAKSRSGFSEALDRVKKVYGV
jgi:hypothetical protein